MKLLLLLLLSILGASIAYQELREPECGATLNNLWVDVVAIIDNSKGMGKDGLIKISATLSSIFGTGIQIGSGIRRSTRVGIITYSDSTQIVADLNEIQSPEQLQKVVFSSAVSVGSSEHSYLANGLVAAEKMFNDDSQREKYRKVVIVFAASYKETGKLTPFVQAAKMKGNSIRIITVGFDQQGGGELLVKLAKIATPGFNFTNAGSIVKPVQNALMQANCYCPNDWVQYQDSNNRFYKSCLNHAKIESIWETARKGCQEMLNGAYLANEYSQSKKDFISLYTNTSTTYFNGLIRVGGVWMWDQPDYLKPLGGYSNWDYGYPDSRDGFDRVINVKVNGVTRWQNVEKTEAMDYVCETLAYDTDNFPF
uniref:VWFA domain-containing protein n=1 Tax=Caenorhabditis tropicalis TaxID=1561998 RepID=A0A1I7UTG0_9PELO